MDAEGWMLRDGCCGMDAVGNEATVCGECDDQGMQDKQDEWRAANNTAYEWLSGSATSTMTGDNTRTTSSVLTRTR